MTRENWCCPHGIGWHMSHVYRAGQEPPLGRLCNVCGSACDGWPGDERLRPIPAQPASTPEETQ